jgi:ABC-type transport system involved in multi-copper enzyme maturation permease subunit
MSELLRVAGFTLLDQLRQRSFFIMTVLSVLLVLMLRSCYDGNYSMNGQELDSATISATASKAAFHVIANVSLLIAALLSMSVISRDHGDGSDILFLSHALPRRSYILGRTLGVWGVSFLFMFALHLTLFLIAYAKTGTVIPGYLTASVLCSINLLFMVFCVHLLSLYVPDFLAALIALGVAGVSYVSDSVHAVLNSEMLQDNIPNELDQAPALWRVAWPKIMLLQQYAASAMGEVHFQGMGPLHPALNVSLYVALFAALLVWSFSRREL